MGRLAAGQGHVPAGWSRARRLRHPLGKIILGHGDVDLDDLQSAMVSNLLVVLCSEQATKQVVNTGSRYQ
jgi:hypothetical protein